MRRSHSVSETSVGLFAFLDVLMSTMGSLILVLMIVSPRIRQEKIAKAATEAARDVVKVEPAPKPVPKPTPVVARPRETIDLNAKFATHVAELSTSADDRRRTAADAQRSLSAARESSQRTRENREQLERELAQLGDAKSRTLASVEDLSAEGVKIESELAKSGSRLRKIRDQIARESTEYDFVAYDGVSGTTRRPILIECANDQIKFPQENITLTSADITGFTTASNPLLAGAQALLDYWLKHSAANDPKPYVLIVVRPSGTLAYYRARNLLERMKAPFGYELLPEDQPLAVRTPDPQAVVACRQAVDQAIAKRDSVFDQVFATRGGLNARNPLRGGAGGSRDDLPGGAGTGTGGKPNSARDDPFDLSSSNSKATAKGPGGNAVVSAGNVAGGSAALGLVSAGGAGAGGASAGGANAGGAGAGGVGAGGASPVGLGSGGVGPNGIASGGVGSGGVGGGGGVGPVPGGVGAGGVGAGGVAMNNGTGAGNSNGSDQNGTGAIKPGGSLPGSPGGELVASEGAGSGAEGQSGAGRPTSPLELLPPQGTGGSSAGKANETGTDPNAGDLRFPEGDTTFSQAGQPRTGQLPSGLGAPLSSPGFQTGAGGTQSGSALDGIASGGGGSSGAGGGGGSGQSDPSADPSADPSTAGPVQPGSPQPVSQADNTGSQGQSALPGGSPAGTNAGADAGGEPGQSSAGSAEESGAAAMPSFGRADDDPLNQSGAKRHWGYSSPQANIGFEHAVTIWIGAHAVVVGGQPPVSINGAESTPRLAALVIPALDREARTWGRPPDHLYWVPNIKFVVSPGGNLPYERLRPAIARHSLISSVEYRLEMESPRQAFSSWVQ